MRTSLAKTVRQSLVRNQPAHLRTDRCAADQPARRDYLDGDRLQSLARTGLTPIPAIGRDWERFGADHLTPDAARQTEAVAANAPEARLVMIRRAEPGSRNGDHPFGCCQTNAN